jgi:hypothetical protein
VDEHLRVLERDATANDASALLAYARALQRAGRRDEAFTALVRGKDDTRVRSELRRFPAWTHESADAGQTRSLDVAPLRRAPRVRWSVISRSTARSHEPHFLLASPLGIVTALPERGGVIAVLDPDTGERLWDVRPVPLRVPVSVGDRLFLNLGLKLVGFDLVTGERLHRVGSGGVTCLIDRDLIIVERMGELVTHVLGAPHQEPRRDRTRVFPRPAGLAAIRFVAGGDVLLQDEATSTQLVAFDRATGKKLWERGKPGYAWGRGVSLLADRDGILVATSHPPGSELRDLSGALVASLPGYPCALTPELALLGDPTGLVAFERSSHRLVGLVAEGRSAARIAVARDVVYVPREHHEIEARALDGKQLWRAVIPERHRYGGWLTLAAYPGRLYVACRHETETSVHCLEE